MDNDTAIPAFSEWIVVPARVSKRRKVSDGYVEVFRVNGRWYWHVRFAAPFAPATSYPVGPFPSMRAAIADSHC